MATCCLRRHIRLGCMQGTCIRSEKTFLALKHLSRAVHWLCRQGTIGMHQFGSLVSKYRC